MTNMASPVVSISEGKIRGSIGKDFDDNQFYSFLGIPYAKPPLGDLRFKAPQPVEPWSGIKDALKEGDSCMQRDFFSQTILGSEDCLHLNVFTRTLPEQENKLKPVMLFIHGGAFVQGSGDSKFYGPEHLMTEDVVLVTINYRLGYLGFLRLEDPSLEVPGNAGLKDQVLALKWVQRNIKNFNGDPNNVTIFGESAGGSSVHYLVLSPSAKGLFHKAIAQSGMVMNPWAFTDSNIMDFLDFMKKGVTDEKAALEVLKKLPIEELMKYQDEFLNSYPPILGIIGPVIEKPNPTAFLTKNPMELMASGKYTKVPMLLGYTSNEGMLMDHLQRLSEKKFNQIDNQPDLEDFVLPYMKLERGCSASQQICKKLADVYLQPDNAINRIKVTRNYSDRKMEFCDVMTEEKYQEVDYVTKVCVLVTSQPFSITIICTLGMWAYPVPKKLLGDYQFITGLLISAIQQSKTSDLPVFLYRLSCETNLNLWKRVLKLDRWPGVCHGDDLGYLFTNSVDHNVDIGEIEIVCMRRILKLWTNFARYGNPTPNGSDLNIQWKPFKGENGAFLDIGRELTLHTKPEGDRMKCWKEILQLSPATAKYII